MIGLTGGLGSGKSTVSQFLQELGATLLDADKVGHETYLPDTPAWRDLIAAFGQGIVGANREIDRKKLGPIVFGDPAKLAQLNSIVHPRLRDLLFDRLEKFRAQGIRNVVLEAAILIEANWVHLVDEVWVVQAPEDVVIERVKKRNNLPEDQIRQRIRSQLPNEERAKYADVIIDTNCSLDAVKHRVQAAWHQRVAAK
ncbi:MAG: dephospho-CoA kinase, partial [Chloroflexi bacterium]|nr:dephospho-CoA kinase [Chloroflexota bacterium]